MSQYWHPPQSYHPENSILRNLPRWHRRQEHNYIYQFLLGNLDTLAEPSSPAPVTQFSGQKRKAIKLEAVNQEPCKHLFWHKSYPYCSICLDPSIVKKEDLEV
jgi:hypothetical protein